VRVAARLDGDVLAMEVADWGPALDADAASPHARDRGLGLGLQLCRSLMRHAGGSLETTVGADGGTVASVRLPLSAAEG
jgi:C4-dicarboxylate-specific signal transduction histidine kinase